MTIPWDDNPPDDCDAPESHPDGCACVRPAFGEAVIGEAGAPTALTDPEEILAALPVSIPPAVRDEIRATVRTMRRLSEAGHVSVLPSGATVCFLSPADVEPEHCPVCIEAEAQRRRLADVEPCPVHRAKEEQ